MIYIVTTFRFGMSRAYPHNYADVCVSVLRINANHPPGWSKDALKTLATLNRMSYVNAGLFLLQLQRARIAFNSGDRDRCCQILTMEVRQMIPRIFLIDFCQMPGNA